MYLDLAGRLESLLRLQVARNVLCVHMLCTGVAYSQRLSTSFGPTIDFSLGYTPVGIVNASPSSHVAVLDQESASVFFYAVKSPAQFVQTDVLKLATTAAEITAASTQPKHKSEFGLLSKEGDSVLVITEVSNGFHQKVIALDVRSQHLAFGDLNSDKTEDLLLFGKKRTGISSFLGQKDGSYRPGPTVFPDLSVSDVITIDLNGDGISDLLVLDWLANRLSLSYGIGRGVFTEQVSVELPAEPTSIAVTQVTKERTVRIAVCIPEENLVSLFSCNATGEIEPIGNLNFASAPLRSRFADINDDQIPDLIVTTGRAIYVLLGKSDGELGLPVAFGAGNGIVGCSVCDLDGDSRSDLVVIDQATKRLIGYANARWSGTIEWPSTYGVGSKPKGIAVLDVNGDGLLDIVVANSGSSTLSVLLNLGKGRLSGQQVVPIPEQPVAIKTVNTESRTEPMVATSHATVDKISVVKFSDDVSAAGVFALPTGSSPYVVLARGDSSTGQLELLTRYAGGRDGSLSLSLFRQISGGQFLERSIRPVVPGYITALTVDDYSNSGRYDLLFVTNDKATKQSTLSAAYATEGFDFKTVKQLLSFPDSTACVHSIISGYLDDDPYKDIILLMSPPRNAFGILYGRQDGSFKDTLDFIRNVQPLDEDAVVIQDADGDGHRDITWVDVGKNAVLTMYGKGNRRFEPPVSVCSGNRVTSIEIGGIKSSHSRDLILANGSKGFISVIFAPFLK